MRLRDLVRMLCFWVRRLCRVLALVLYGLSVKSVIIFPSGTRVPCNFNQILTKVHVISPLFLFRGSRVFKTRVP